jgi:glycosyltransferase involved in cell wall biosynthesis
MDFQDVKKVSIVLCTYNGEKYLKEQLDSILSQTYPIYEFIIRDDLSSDGTVDIIKEYQQKYPVINFRQNEKNLGYNANFSTAIKEATGDFIAISDQDDIWLPDKIGILMEHIGNKLLIFSQSALFDKDKPGWVLIDYPTAPDTSLECMAFGNWISGHSVLLRKNLIDKIPFWDSRYYYDWWLAIVAAYFDGVAFYGMPLIKWRRHHEAVTQKFLLRQESKLTKLLKVKDFLHRRKNYLHVLYDLLDQLEETPNKNRKKFKKIIQCTYNNNPFLTFIACCNCLKLTKTYYPKTSKYSLRMYYNSFLKPIKCRGF